MTNQKIQTFIADDEHTSREILRKFIEKYCPSLQIVGYAENALQAVDKINQLKPQLVFLDVEMPFGNAFDVLDQTSHIEYDTIFVTAYSDYAIKAFNFSAAYYILKPINIEELIKAVDKVKNKISNISSSQINDILKTNMNTKNFKKLVLPTLHGYDIINTSEIIRMEGSGNYTDIFLKDGKKKTISKILKYFDDLLEGSSFIRIHKSHIINPEFIKSYHKGKGGSLIMSDGVEVEVSPSKKDMILSIIFGT